MTGRVWTLAAAFTVVALAGCQASKSGTSSAPPAPFVGLTASASSVVANGTNTVALSYTNTGGGNATLTTDHGQFQGGATTLVLAQASGTVNLVATTGYSGVVTITLTASSGSANANVTFQTVAAACQNNCSADANCASLSCSLTGGGAGVCASGTCVAGAACTPTPAGSTSEVSCSDGIDNDCNGSKDCADSACDGQACKVGAPTFVCRSGACTDLASGLAVTVTPARSRLPAVGNVSTDVVVEVTYQTDPAPSLTVTVALSDPALGSITPPSAMTDASGKAHFTFTGNAATGTETITATLAAMPSVSGFALVTLPRLASLRLLDPITDSVQFQVMGAKGSGWQDLGFVKVMAVDDFGLPYPDGLPVRFEHRQLGFGASASTLGVPLTADTASCRAANQCVGYQAVTASLGANVQPDTAGIAQAWIYSGTVAGTLPVTASASAGGASFTVLLPTITVVGAKASGSNFSVVCSPRNLPALAETDCAISLVDAPFTCEAILKDRYDNVLGRSTQVIFGAEAGAVGQVTSTPEYDPTKSGNGQLDLGIAVQGFNTLGAGLPYDVAPFTAIGEPSVVVQFDQCGDRLDPLQRRTHNPRDGVVTIIAIADGEEAFFDTNGNGTYDAGEPFVDLGEPFIDQDDDGIWTPGEWFLDLDGNGTWTPPNGRWDANTKIWTQTFVVYTGQAERTVSGGRFMGTRISDPSSFVDACTSTAAPTPWDVFFETTIQPATSQSYVVVAADRNLNFLQTAATYDVDFVSADADIKVFYGGEKSYGDLTGLSWRYWPCANNGTGACASQCRATGANAPCGMKPEFLDFSCGLTTGMTVTGGTKATSATLRWDVTVPWERYGTGLIDTHREGVSGRSR